jgi:hypothetical protein
MVPFPLIWLQCRAAQERLRETFAESSLPSEESHLKSSPPVAQADGETASTEVDPIAPELSGKDEGERPAKKRTHRLEIAGKEFVNFGFCYYRHPF